MINMQELIKDKDFNTLDPQIQINLQTLLERLNKLRGIWGKPMTITSGLRTMEEHLRIYADKGITDSSKIPLLSKHLSGKAADIYDPNFELTNFCKANVNQVLKDCILWAEDDTTTPRLHLQTVAPLSGVRWFKP